MTLRLHKRQINRMAAKLALAMLVADLAGRARVLAEIERSTGRRFRPATGLSFKENRGGLDDGGSATSAAPVIFGEVSAGGCDGPPVRRVLLKAKNRSDFFAEEDEAQVLAPARLEPKAALDFFRQKLAMARPAFNKLAKRYRDTAFTVANVESVKLIEEIQGELDRAIAQGLTQEQFRQAVDARFRAAGLQPLDPFHLETVFRTNVASAYAAGRASQMLQPEVRSALPYWEYSTVGDSRVRDEHAALDGFIARWDDPVWRKIFPPNGYNCRCKALPILAQTARERAAARGQDLGTPGGERLPEEAHIDFDNSPVDRLAQTAEGRAPALSTSGRLSAKEITAKAVDLRKKIAKRYEAAKAKSDRLAREADAALRRVERASEAELPARWREFEEASAPALEARGKFEAIKSGFDRRIHEMVRSPTPRRLTAERLSRVDVGRARVWEAGVREFNRLVSVGPETGVVRFAAGGKGRSSFDPVSRRLEMAPGAPVRTVLHEMGHWLEHHDMRVMRAAEAFLARRTKGERPLPLRRLTGKRYQRDEVAKIDKFLDVYMGKVYTEGHGTEIVAIGLEWLYDEPYRLLGDPDYFEFLIGLLAGEGL